MMTPRSRQWPTWRRSRSRIEFVVTNEERALLDRVAQENRGTIAKVVRDAVNEYVNDYSERRVFLPDCRRQMKGRPR